MAHTTSFAERVDSAEQKAQRIEDANNTKQQIDSVTKDIDELRRKLEKVSQKAEELEFYVGILETVFNGSRSDWHGLPAEIDDARRKANISDEEIIEAAENKSFAEHRSTLQEADDHLDSSIKNIKTHIEDEYVEEYSDELDSAKELNAIISGENDQFVTQIKQMQRFLSKGIWRTDKSVASLASRWDRMRDQWQAHSDKQGWERFQQQHRLSETTIAELQQFTDKDVVNLSDLSIETLKEIKRVDELESALEVSLQT